MREIPFPSCPSALVAAGRDGPGFMKANELDLYLPSQTDSAPHLDPPVNGVIELPSWSTELILVVWIRES